MFTFWGINSQNPKIKNGSGIQNVCHVCDASSLSYIFAIPIGRPSLLHANFIVCSISFSSPPSSFFATTVTATDVDIAQRYATRHESIHKTILARINRHMLVYVCVLILNENTDNEIQCNSLIIMTCSSFRQKKKTDNDDDCDKKEEIETNDSFSAI